MNHTSCESICGIPGPARELHKPWSLCTNQCGQTPCLNYKLGKFHCSALTNLVPVLKGPNYKMWYPLMQSFLKSQRQWRVTCKSPPALIPAKPATKTEEAVTGNQDNVDEWFNLNSKALGNIQLRLHHTIQYKHHMMKIAGKMLAVRIYF